MAFRRRKSDSDSLELMLDTICNVFGGIMFIALLLALFTSTQAMQIEDTAVQRDRDARPATRAAEAAGLRHRIASDERSIDWMRQQTSTLGDDREREAGDIIKSVESRVREAEQQREELRQWLERHQEVVEKQEQQLGEQVEQTRAAIESLEQELSELREAHSVDARLPQARRTTRTQLILQMKGGRLHWIPLGPAAQMFPRFADDVDMQQFPGPVYRVRPAAGGGEAVPEQVDQMERFNVMTGRADPQDHFFDLYVWSDSVEAFRRLRDALTARGFRYQVHPMSAGRVLQLGTTNEPLSTQ